MIAETVIGNRVLLFEWMTHDGRSEKARFLRGHSEMIWTHLICSNCIILRLITKQLLAKFSY